jgi:hypothetical protein
MTAANHRANAYGAFEARVARIADTFAADAVALVETISWTIFVVLIREKFALELKFHLKLIIIENRKVPKACV